MVSTLEGAKWCTKFKLLIRAEVVQPTDVYPYIYFQCNDAHTSNWNIQRIGALHHTSHSRGCTCRIHSGRARPPSSTWVTWATVPSQQPEDPSWVPSPRQNRTRRRRDSSCLAGPSTCPCPSASRGRLSRPLSSAGPSIALGFRRSARQSAITTGACGSDGMS